MKGLTTVMRALIYQAGWTTRRPFRSFFSLDIMTAFFESGPQCEDADRPAATSPTSKTNAPPVDQCVALVEPPDGREFVPGSHGTQVDQQVVFRHHQVQGPNDVPSGDDDEHDDDQIPSY